MRGSGCKCFTVQGWRQAGVWGTKPINGGVLEGDIPTTVVSGKQVHDVFSSERIWIGSMMALREGGGGVSTSSRACDSTIPITIGSS